MILIKNITLAPMLSKIKKRIDRKHLIGGSVLIYITFMLWIKNVTLKRHSKDLSKTDSDTRMGMQEKNGSTWTMVNTNDSQVSHGDEEGG